MGETTTMIWMTDRQEGGIYEQSFFDPLPAGADLYLLKSILKDWHDREARLILSRCAQASIPAVVW